MNTYDDREEKMKAAARKKRRNRSTVKVIFAMLGCLVLLVAVMYGGLTLIDKHMNREQEDIPAMADDVEGDAVDAVSDAVVYSQEELDEKIAEAVSAAQNERADKVLEGIRTSLSEGTTTVETLRPYYPDDIVVVSGGKFHFVPINRELKLNNYEVTNLNILENGEFQYLTDGQVTSHKGIDVSSHQGNIDWNLVAQDGVEFAIIRVGYRGYGSEGRLVVDEKFENNIKGATAAGIKVGVYFFSQAINEAELLEEANLVLEQIAPYKIECPVVYDVEKTSAQGRMNAISVEERTQLTKLFCQTIADAGYRPMIYHNTEMGALLINIAELEDYDKWYASYSDQMFYPYDYKIWQYSDKGKIQG
ncbi:MAG: hypothetical protein MRZ49_12180, partial [Lachnospiraceae bacterium]|nr:hypothetical protein [Lachnospiraceae bacterium]